jgi:hypothetical protein
MWNKEIKRIKYYNRLKKHSLNNFKLNSTPDDNINTIQIIFDVLSLLIFNHKFESNEDPIFDSKSPFTTSFIQEYIKCVPGYTNALKIFLKFNDIISEKYLKYYKKLQKFVDTKDNPNITYEITTNVTLFGPNNKKIKLPISLFTHLVKLYNTNIGEYNNNIPNDDCLLKIWIVYKRYKAFSSGNNQASILPHFKLKLKELLNIKTELFGSPLNTSNMRFGSFFYDIDKYFGSLGNFFDIDTTKGYYELNPVFDICLIDKVFNKLVDSLEIADKNKNPLLFLIIIPTSYKENIEERFGRFLIFKNRYKKFKFMRFSRKYNKTIISGISKVYIIVAATDYVSTYVKYNYSKISEIISEFT